MRCCRIRNEVVSDDRQTEACALVNGAQGVEFGGQLGAADDIGREADVGLRYGNGDWPGLEARLVLRSSVVVVASLLAVALLMTPSLARLVADRRFVGLQRKHGSSWLYGVLWTLLSLLLFLRVNFWFCRLHHACQTDTCY